MDSTKTLENDRTKTIEIPHRALIYILKVYIEYIEVVLPILG